MSEVLVPINGQLCECGELLPLRLSMKITDPVQCLMCWRTYRMKVSFIEVAQFEDEEAPADDV